ncbi:MAG TPA: hypothetical protein ENI23_06715 [bacterium]|nr:hypothetical protein [bacterium]
MITKKTVHRLSDNELVVSIAEKLLGWKKREPFHNPNGDYLSHSWWHNGKFMDWSNTWNPLKDWNHTHQVLDKLMKDEKLTMKLVNALIPDHTKNWHRWGMWSYYVKASQEQLMDTLVSLLTSKT